MQLIKRSLLLCWLLLFGLMTSYAFPAITELKGWGYLATATAFQASLLITPLLFVAAVYKKKPKACIAYLFHCLAISIILLSLSNYKLHATYHFFIDQFVIHILTTTNGIEALGLSHAVYISAIIVGILVAISYVIVVIFVKTEYLLTQLPQAKTLITVVLCCFITQASLYSWGDFKSNTEILNLSSRIAWYIPITSRHLIEKLGVKQTESKAYKFENLSNNKLDYPTQALDNKGIIRKPYNIIWIICDSLRHNIITPSIMPKTSQFANDNAWFKSHYSGGNNTEMGLFSQFYGIYGSYWHDIEQQLTPPLLLETLIANHYDMRAYTSPDYRPEFHKTIFAGFKPEQIQEYSKGTGWQRDVKNTTDLIHYISAKERKNKPFFSFLFFQSTQTNNSSPEVSAIKNDYLDDVELSSSDTSKSISIIKSRYLNANHSVDSQLGRIFNALKKQQLEDNTIVIVTGDHGEQFSKKGLSAHNATMSQEQSRVPLIIHMPGRSPSINTMMSSHLDIPSTIFSALGFETPAHSYSFGHDLFDARYRRDYSVTSNENNLFSHDIKLVLSFNSMHHATVNNQKIDNEQISLAEKYKLSEFIQKLPRFYLDSTENNRVKMPSN